jgi:hypothetical protein
MEGAPYCDFIENKKVSCTKKPTKNKKEGRSPQRKVTAELTPSMRTVLEQFLVSSCIEAMIVPGTELLCISVFTVEYDQTSNHSGTSRCSKT